MRRRRRLAWLALLGLGLACGSTKDPKTLNGTAFFVTVFFDTDLDVRALEFIGTNRAGNDVFQRDTRPSPAAAKALLSPQTVRILLKDSLAREPIELSVFGFDALGERVEYGSTSATVVEGREEDVTVNMKRFDLGTGGGAGGGGVGGMGGSAGSGGAGGGSGGMGGAGGGVIKVDAGFLDGGVSPRCGCDGGCCVPGATTCAVPTVVVYPLPNALPGLMLSGIFCGGKSGEACTLVCDPLRASRCEQGACRCGAGPACSFGMRCGEVAKDSFACVCDTFSQCSGCCSSTDAGVACRGPGQPQDITYGACGAAGNACAACTGNVVSNPRCAFGLNNPGACSSSLLCAACIARDRCCTHLACAPTSFPTCRAPDSNACVACDLIRSDGCEGNFGMSVGGCSCGGGPPCPFYQACRRVDGGPSFCG